MICARQRHYCSDNNLRTRAEESVRTSTALGSALDGNLAPRLRRSETMGTRFNWGAKVAQGPSGTPRMPVWFLDR